MVAPGFLDNPEVRRWLGGIQPAWTMLEVNSLNALFHEPSGSNHAIRLEPNLTNAELAGSAVTANALLLLRQAAETGGLKLTATGNLSRAVVEEMCEILQWPGYDKDELFGFHKVINEPDFYPLHFVRILTKPQSSCENIAESWYRLLRVGKSSAGKSMDRYRLFSSMSPCGV